jgi:hypothetical protein
MERRTHEKDFYSIQPLSSFRILSLLDSIAFIGLAEWGYYLCGQECAREREWAVVDRRLQYHSGSD